jgi:hypothetical protein
MFYIIIDILLIHVELNNKIVEVNELNIKTAVTILKPILKQEGLKDRLCKNIDAFILILKTIEEVDGDIPGINIYLTTDEDNLNEGETFTDLTSGEVGHYCRKVTDGEKIISNDKLEEWANIFLITSEGTPNWENINIMKENGFNVGPGEADSFGWLSGIISTKKGKIVFG